VSICLVIDIVQYYCCQKGAYGQFLPACGWDLVLLFCISINSGNGFQVGNGLIFELQNLMLIDYKLNGRETLSN
jgi:hypothetical protein